MSQRPSIPGGRPGGLSHAQQQLDDKLIELFIAAAASGQRGYVEVMRLDPVRRVTAKAAGRARTTVGVVGRA